MKPAFLEQFEKFAQCCETLALRTPTSADRRRFIAMAGLSAGNKRLDKKTKGSGIGRPMTSHARSSEEAKAIRLDKAHGA
jgi:hypothetical protein